VAIWLIIFICVPILELYTLLEVGQLVGVPVTLGLILLTGISGAYLARIQGTALLTQIQSEMAAGRVPADPLINGLMVFAGGVLLLTPGFWTDLVGFCMLVPGTRNLIKKFIVHWLQEKIREGHVTIYRQH